jgi:hypothetical protein
MMQHGGPVECTGCGLRLAGDQTIWLGPSWDDRKQFCAECARSEERRLARLGV